MPDNKLSLVDHVFLTYRSLRVALVITCFAIPVGLIVIGFTAGFNIQDSLSDYYYAEYPPMILRVIFVGLLFLLGGLLIAYRGFNNTDNWIHNLAGVFAWGVAIFPMKCPHAQSPFSDLCFTLGPSYLHYGSALLLFGLAIVSIYYNGGPRFKEVSERYISKDNKISHFKIARFFSGVVVGFGVLYALVMLGVGGRDLFGEFVWFYESLGFIGFGMYWGFFTYYIAAANKKAEEQKIEKKEMKDMRDEAESFVIEEEGIGERPTRAIP